MRYALYLLALCCLASCGSIKHVHTSTTVVKDTTASTAINDHYTGHTDVTSITKRDSIIKFPAVDLSQTFTAAQLSPAHTDKGDAVPHSYHVDKGNLHQTVTVDTNGYIQVDCNADSLIAVVQNLTDITRSQRDSITKLLSSSTVKTSDTAVTVTDYTKVVKSWWSSYKWWIIGIVVLCIIVEVVYKFFIKK